MKREIGLLILAFVGAGCGAKNNSCVPGQAAACVCSDGTGGAQTCRSDGTYAACDCSRGNVGGNGSGGDMALGGGAGGGGAGGGGAGGGGGGGVTPGAKRLFVTSTKYAATAVNGICQKVADSVTLGGTWVEWLSYATNVTPVSAIDIVKGTGPWQLLDGTVAFANHAQLATAPSVALSLTERGMAVSNTDDDVWTGTLTGGAHSDSDCDNWTMTGYSASIGRATVASEWTAYGANISCTNNTAHVYCFEQ